MDIGVKTPVSTIKIARRGVVLMLPKVLGTVWRRFVLNALQLHGRTTQKGSGPNDVARLVKDDWDSRRITNLIMKALINLKHI